MAVVSTCFCLETVSGNDFGDIQLRCSCLVHHDCLVQYIQSQLGDRLSLFSSIQKHNEEEMLHCAIICPYTYSGSCRGSKHSKVMQPSLLSIRSSSSLEISIQNLSFESINPTADALFAINYISIHELDFLANFEEKHFDKFNQKIRISDVDKIRRWIKECLTTTVPSKEAKKPEQYLCLASDIKTEVFVNATAKACPSCRTRGTHYHGHHCHHISPSGGCTGCGTNYCYRCLSTEEDNLRATGNSSRCLCGSWSTFCCNDNIGRFAVAQPYPHDSRCGCAFCPDCSPKKSCDLCNGNCVVCLGIVPPGPRQLSSKTEMKLAKEIVEQRCPVATRLLAACGRGDLQIVKELFETDLNQILAMAPLLRDSNGRTPLHFLCRGASCDEVKRLELLDLLLPHLSATEMLEVVDASGHTALACAAAKGNAAVLERLLRAGADANGGQRNNGFTALMNCAEAGRIDCARLLLQSGHCDVERVSATRDTALSLAVQSGSADMVSLLLEHQRLPTSAPPSSAREPLLHIAAAYGHVAVAVLLMGGHSGGGLCVDELDRFGYTALHKAVANNRLEFIEQVLLPHRASLNISDSIHQETALMKACKRGLADVIRLLLRQDGIDTLARTRCGDTAASLCRPSVPQELRTLLHGTSSSAGSTATATAPPSHSGRDPARRVNMDMKSEKYLQQLEDSTAACPFKVRAVTRTMAREIVRARTALNLTQAALAGRVGVSRQVIQQLEAAKGIQDINLVRRVGKALCISLDST